MSFYVVNFKLLSSLNVRYPLTIDPTASVSRTTVGTSSTTFYVGREHQASYTYDLYGWNDDAKVQLITIATLGLETQEGL